MPQETAKITFYKVNECGFYARGETTPKFGSIQDLLLSLEDWSQGKQLVETKTYEPNGSSEQMPCYLLNILSSGSSWLVTIWNETPSTDGQTASAVGTSNVGNAQIVMNELPEGGIPGFATYFWFIPELNIFASIRFQHLISGQKPMQLYMESYLALFLILPSNDGHLKNVIHCNEVNHGKIDDINEEKILYPLLRYLSARSVSAC